MPRLIDTDKDLGLLAAAAFKGYAGYKGYGLDDEEEVSTGKKIGRGLSASTQPYGDFLTDERTAESTKSKMRLDAANARKIEIENENMTKPYKYKELIAIFDPSGVTGDEVGRLLNDRGLDLDGSGTINETEFQEGFRKGDISWKEINPILTRAHQRTAESIKQLKKDLSARVDNMAAKSGDGSTGAKYNIESLNRPEIAALYPKEKKVYDQLKATEALLESQAKEVEKVRRISIEDEQWTKADYEGLNIKNRMETISNAHPDMDTRDVLELAVMDNGGRDLKLGLYRAHGISFDRNTATKAEAENISTRAIEAALLIMGYTEKVAIQIAPGMKESIMVQADINDKEAIRQLGIKAQGITHDGGASRELGTPKNVGEELGTNLEDLWDKMTPKERALWKQYGYGG
jgi:hypothetical protein